MYERYCKLRDALGYRDSDVAKGTGITKSTFSDWKNGRSIPKEEKLKKIALFLNTSVDYLRYGDKTPSYDLITDIPHTKTTNQEIIEFANQIMSDEDETFRKRFISALAKAKPEFWDSLERIVDETLNKD